jgi:hypothetical protein
MTGVSLHVLVFLAGETGEMGLVNGVEMIMTAWPHFIVTEETQNVTVRARDGQLIKW